MSSHNKQIVSTKRVVSLSGQPSSKKKVKRTKRSTKSSNTSIDVSIPVAISSKITSSEPRQIVIKNGVQLVGSELVSTLNKGVTAEGSLNPLIQLLRLRCNPGSAKTFPWAHRIATNYEFYRFRKLHFRFETRSSTLMTGSIIISPDYDAADGQVAVSEQFLYMNKGTTDDSVWKRQVCPLKTESMNRLYKSHAIMSDLRFQSSNQDEKTIDCAQVFVCVETNTAAPESYGKLFVDYIVDCTEPQNPTEPINQGGVAAALGIMGPNLDKPLGAIREIIADPGVAVAASSIANLTLPTATIAKFIKDYEGVLTMNVNGSLASPVGRQWPNIYLGTDPNSPAGGSGDRELPANGDMSFSSPGVTYANGVYRVVAKAGEVLKMKSPNVVSINQMLMQLAGSTANVV